MPIIKTISNYDDEKNMLFRDIDELLIHWRNYAKTTNNKSLHQFKNAMALGQTHPLAQHSGCIRNPASPVIQYRKFR
jgi:hypothetical protein